MSQQVTMLFITDEFEKLFQGQFLSDLYNEFHNDIANNGLFLKYNNPTANLDKTIDKQWLIDNADTNNGKAYNDNQIPVHVKLEVTDYMLKDTGMKMYRKRYFMYAFLELNGIVEFNNVSYVGKSDAYELIKAIIQYEENTNKIN